MRRNAWKGLVAGTVAGLAASFVMTGLQQLWSKLAKRLSRSKGHQGGQVGKSESERRRQREPESPTEKAAHRISRALDRDPSRREKKMLGQLIHYGFGTATGALYGAAAELDERVAAGSGIPFGAAVWIAADEVAVPASGLSRSPLEYPVSVHLQSLFSHLVYGAATDIVRRIVRKAL
jgi:putative membrane protein